MGLFGTKKKKLSDFQDKKAELLALKKENKKYDEYQKVNKQLKAEKKKKFDRSTSGRVLKAGKSVLKQTGKFLNDIQEENRKQQKKQTKKKQEPFKFEF